MQKRITIIVVNRKKEKLDKQGIAIKRFLVFVFGEKIYVRYDYESV